MLPGNHAGRVRSSVEKSRAYNLSMGHELNSFAKVSDDELLCRLSELLQKSRRVESELVAHIGEVDARRLYAREAASSMFVYCTEILHLSEHEAYLRIGAARASRQHPVLLEMLGDGRLKLTAVARLGTHLTEANRDSVLARAVGRSKQEIEELIAELSPKPDVPASVRKLPVRHAPATAAPASQLVPERATNLHTPTTAAQQPVMKPLAPARYKVQFTASAELHEKLNRLRALMRSSVPAADLAALIEVAVTEKLERLEAKRFAKTKAPRKSLKETNTAPSSRYIPAPVRRAVRERDGNRCTFVGANGRRCTREDNLEFHHRDPFGLGGGHDVENLQLLCRAHNGYFAERDYGREVMDRYRAQVSTR